MAKASKSRVKPLPSRASEHLDHVDSMVRAVETREAGVEIGLVLEEVHVPPAFQRRIVGLAALGITEGAGEGPTLLEVKIDVDPGCAPDRR
jgi:hypothetical protein